MEYLSEVLKILDGALKANATMAASYAGLLADKLESAGDKKQATLLRERLVRAPTAIARAQDASRPSGMGAPVDADSRSHTVDISYPAADAVQLVLPGGTGKRISDFLDSIRHYDELARAGVAQPNRLLLYGPPGTGKTQTARWVSGQLKLPLLTVRCDTLISSLLGQTSKNIRRVFEYAEGHPSVLFLDEFDALAAARGNERDVGELQRVVISLLQNIDALSPSTILVAATNFEVGLDRAVWRRFGFQVPMPLPDEHLRELIWREHLGSFAPANVDLRGLAKRSDGLSGAAIEQVSIDAKRNAVFARRSIVSEAELYRRLGLTIALLQGKTLTSIGDEVGWLRGWDEKRFSLRELAKLYGVSTRAITNLLKENGHGKAKSKP